MFFSPPMMALTACIFTWAVTALGSAVVFFFKKTNRRFMDSMLGFSAGIMLAASFFSLISPALILSDEIGTGLLPVLTGFIFGGAFLFTGDYLFGKALSRLEFKSSKRLFMLICSMTLHNIPEGLAIGVAFGAADGEIGSAVMLAIGIGIQNFPEGSAISLPLMAAGYSRKKAFFIGQLSAAVEPIAGFIGAVMVTQVRMLLPFCLSFAASAMIYVVISEMIPEFSSEKIYGGKIALMLGFILMMTLDVVFS